MKSEESNWWKPGTKENLKYDDYKPQKGQEALKTEEAKFTSVQIEEDDDEAQEAEVAEKLESSAADIRDAEAKARAQL